MDLNQPQHPMNDRPSHDRSWLLLGGVFIAVAVVVYLQALAHPDRLLATHVASVASACSAGASMWLIRRGLRRGPDAIAGSFIASSLVRSAISIGGCVAGILWLHLSPGVTLLTMTAYYFATLAAETHIAVQRLRMIQSRKAL